MIFERQRQLSTEAIITLKYGSGLLVFYGRYGNYYVASYRLGGSNAAEMEIEKLGITVRVKFFLLERASHTPRNLRLPQQSSIRPLGYDTLDHQNWNSSVKNHGAAAADLRSQALQVVLRSQVLDIGLRRHWIIKESAKGITLMQGTVRSR